MEQTAILYAYEMFAGMELVDLATLFHMKMLVELPHMDLHRLMCRTDRPA